MREFNFVEFDLHCNVLGHLKHFLAKMQACTRERVLTRERQSEKEKERDEPAGLRSSLISIAQIPLCELLHKVTIHRVASAG